MPFFSLTESGIYYILLIVVAKKVINFCGTKHVGAWRSLVAHLLWEQGVEGSNPFAPTILNYSKFLSGSSSVG